MKKNELLEIIKRIQAKKQEWKTVEVKRELILQELGDKAEFVKDVVAMANNREPSYLVIGLEDRTLLPKGALNHHYTKNDLNQILVDKIDPTIVVDYQEFTIDRNEYAVVEIIGRNPPYIVARDIIHNKHDRKRVRVHKGTIYVRHEDRVVGISRSELEEVFRCELRKEFERETEKALQLALNQPDYWEYLLTAELLETKVAVIKRNFLDLERGLIYKQAKHMSEVDFLNWIASKCTDLTSLIDLLKTATTEEVPKSWGKSGEPGDPLDIKRAVGKVVSGCNELLEWESDLRSVIPPSSFTPLKQKMAGWTLQSFKQIEALPGKILKPFERPDPKGQYDIEIIFEPPPNINEVMVEIAHMQNHPETWIDN
ncbi:MAG: ATP-binding protein [bacterium]